MRSDLHDIKVIFQHQTEAAICVRETEDSRDTWIPKSQCEIEPCHPRRGDAITLTASEKTLTEKGLV